jgi:hypothetical protein
LFGLFCLFGLSRWNLIQPNKPDRPDKPNRPEEEEPIDDQPD